MTQRGSKSATCIARSRLPLPSLERICPNQGFLGCVFNDTRYNDALVPSVPRWYIKQNHTWNVHRTVPFAPPFNKTYLRTYRICTIRLKRRQGPSRSRTACSKMKKNNGTCIARSRLPLLSIECHCAHIEFVKCVCNGNRCNDAIVLPVRRW